MKDFSPNEKVMYAEIKLGTATKRFVFPSEQGVADKLRSFLNNYKNLFLVRYGDAQITEVGDSALGNEVAISGLDFKVDRIYQGQFYGHSDGLPSGSLRFSAELIETVLAQDVVGVGYSDQAFVQSQEQSANQAAPIQTPSNPTDEIRARLEGIKGEPASQSTATAQSVVAEPSAPPVAQVAQAVAAAPVDPSLPVDTRAQEIKKEQQILAAEDELRARCAVAAEKNPPKPASNTQGTYTGPSSAAPVALATSALAGRVEEIHLMVSQLVDAQGIPGKGVTGKELAVWYNESIAKIGYDQTFELLATKISAL